MASMIDAHNKRDKAFALYRQGVYTPKEICEKLGIKYPTFMSWKVRGGWDELPGMKKALLSLDQRLCALYAKTDKTDGDFKEIKVLGDEYRRFEVTAAKLDSYQGKPTSDKDFNPKLSNRGAKKNSEKTALMMNR